MNINEKAEKAVQLKKSGYNCCQAVTAVYAEDVGADAVNLNMAASGFAVGMGCMEATCGSLCGAVMIAGLALKGKGTPAAARRMVSEFADMSGATLCRELKGRDTGVVLCPCEDCVKNAALIAGKFLEDMNRNECDV